MRKSSLFFHFIVICGLLLGNASAFQNQKTIVVKLGDSNVIVDGVKKTYATKPFFKDGKLMVQVDVLREFPGADFKWDINTKTATITVEKPKIYFDSAEYNDLINLIQNTKKKIDIQMYRLTEDGIIKEIKKAATRGVRIRIVLDKHMDNYKEMATGSILEDYLENNNSTCDVRWKNGMKVMHRKIAVFDDSIVFMGSTNWTFHGLCPKKDNNCNWEVGLIYKNDNLVSEFLKQFEYEWTDFTDRTYTPPQ